MNNLEHCIMRNFVICAGQLVLLELSQYSD